MAEPAWPSPGNEPLEAVVLAQQLEALMGQLAEVSRDTRDAARRAVVSACPEALTHVSAGLRSLADAVEAGRADRVAQRRREFTSLVSGLGGAMARLGEVSQGVQARIGAHAREFEALAELPPDRELAARLRDVATRMHEATAELRDELRSAAGEAQRAGDRAAGLGARVPSPPRPDRRGKGPVLHGRAAFDRRLEFAIGTGPFRGPWSLLLAGVDRVDELGERFAVSAVDMLLDRIRRMVGLRVQQKRPDAFAAHYDESTFAAIVPGDVSAAARVAEHLREGIASVRWTVSRQNGTTDLSTTASLGVAAYRVGDTATALTERVLRAVRQARQAGGDRVVSEA